MKNFFKLLGIAALVAVIGLSMTGCMTVAAEHDVETAMIEPLPRDFIILGVVAFERTHRREISYFDMLNEARSQFPTANAVLDVRIEPVTRTVVGFQRRIFAASGIAVEFVSEQ